MFRRLVAVTVLAAATLLPAAQATAGTDSDPMAGARTVGDCFDITSKQSDKPTFTGDPVACRNDHTAVEIAVSKLPSRLGWDSPPEDIATFATRTCAAASGDLIGSNRLQLYRSQYTWLWFTPTQAQQDAGARWVDCMIGIQANRGLDDLPRKLPRLSNKLPDVVARCVTAKYGTTTCAHKHAWRSSYAFYATGKMTDAHVTKAAEHTCPHHVTTPRAWLRSATDVKGKRFIVGCYSKTKH